jgi:hypothetical protein
MIDPDVAQDDGRWLIGNGPNLDAGTCVRLLQRYPVLLYGIHLSSLNLLIYGGVLHDKQSYIAAINFVKFFTCQLDKVTRSEVFKKAYAIALDCPNFIHVCFSMKFATHLILFC